MQITGPVAWRFEFESSGRGTTTRFVARARGDHDCDGRDSVYEVAGAVRRNGELEARSGRWTNRPTVGEVALAAARRYRPSPGDPPIAPDQRAFCDELAAAVGVASMWETRRDSLARFCLRQHEVHRALPPAEASALLQCVRAARAFSRLGTCVDQFLRGAPERLRRDLLCGVASIAATDPVAGTTIRRRYRWFHRCKRVRREGAMLPDAAVFFRCLRRATDEDDVRICFRALPRPAEEE